MSKLSRLASYRQRNEDAPWEVLYFSTEWQPLIRHFESWFSQPVVADSGISREALDDVALKVGLALPLPLREWYRLVGNHPYIQALVTAGALSPAENIVTRVYTGNVILPVYEPRGTVLGPSFRLNGIGGTLYFADYDGSYIPAGRHRQFEDCFHSMSVPFEQLMLAVVADSVVRFPHSHLLHDDMQLLETGGLPYREEFRLSNDDLQPESFWPRWSRNTIHHHTAHVVATTDSNLASIL